MRACCTTIAPVLVRPRRLRSVSAEPMRQGAKAVTVYVPTRKRGEPRMERLRHAGHRSMATMLEADPDVIEWTVEGTTLFDVSALSSVKPSFLVRRKRERSVIKVMERAKLDTAALDRFEDAAAELSAVGIVSELRLREDVDADPRLAVARTLLRLKTWSLREGVLARAAAIAGRGMPRTLDELHDRMGADEDGWIDVLSLIGRGHVDIGLPMRLDGMTAIRSMFEGDVA